MADVITDEVLSELAELAADATPGPWMFIGTEEPHEEIGPIGGPVVALICPTIKDLAARGCYLGAKEIDNALFIANARTWLGPLVEEVRRLRSENERLRLSSRE